MQLQSFSDFASALVDERGSAVLEFVGFGLLMQIPLLMMSMDLVELQQSQFAAEAVARHSLRSFILLGTPVETTAAEILKDFRLTTNPKLELDCKPSTNCAAPGSILTLRVQVGRAQAQSRMINP